MDNNNMNTEKTRTSNKRAQKAERREAKAARKAANKVEEKNSRPNNVLLAVLVFGVLIGMFAFVLGYNYFSKPATIQSYIEKNGGEEVYGNIAIDQYTNAVITAEGNSMNVEMNTEVEDEATAAVYKEFYGGDSGKKQLDYLAAYFLTTIKPETRAFSADVKGSLKLNGEELVSTEMTYKEAEDAMKTDEEAEEASGDENAEEASGEEGAGEGSEVTEDTGEDAAESADETAGEPAEAAEDAAEDAAEAADGE